MINKIIVHVYKPNDPPYMHVYSRSCIAFIKRLSIREAGCGSLPNNTATEAAAMQTSSSDRLS